MSGIVGAAFGNRFNATPNYSPTSTLTTPTYDASGQTTEPTWRKKPSWVTIPGCTDIMSHNPLTGGSSTVENPSLLYSTDNGTTWAVPPGMSTTAPLYGPPATGNYGDCYLWDDAVNGSNTLHMFWLSSETGAQGIWHGTSTDPALVTWSAASRLNSTAGNTVEPKVIWDPVKGRYIMYLVDFNGTPTDYFFKYITATTIAGLTSTTWTPLNITLPKWQGQQQAPWHMDIIRETSGRWIMAFSTGHGQGLGYFAWLASSWNGTDWKCAPRPLMAANSWSGTNGGIYRPSVQPARSGPGYDFICARNQSPVGPNLGLVRNVPATEVP